MQKFSDVVLSRIAGADTITVVSGASILVKTLAGATASIYSDNLGTAQVNPTSSDVDGRFSFYAADGRYTCEVSATDMDSYTLTDILLEDPADGVYTVTDLTVTGSATIGTLNGYLKGTLGLMGAVATIPYTDLTGTPEAFLHVGTANEVTVTEFPVGTFTYSLPASITVNVTGNLTGTASTATNALSLGGNLANTYAPLGSPALTGSPTAPTAAAGTNTTQVATTAFVESAISNSSYRNITNANVLILAGVTADTFDLPLVGTLANAVYGVGGTHASVTSNVFRIDSADFPTVDGKTTKLRVKAALFTNDVAPTGNYTIGLYPVTRPATSGGATNTIYTLGTVVTGSTVLFTTPAADSSNTGNSGDFALPADGYYCLGMVTTATVAASSKVDINAILQMRNA